jgi:hypothetical protein
MRKMVFIFAVVFAFMFIGCAGDTLTITKCKNYKDNICIAKDIKQVKECKNPIKISGKTYCEE